MVGGITSSGSEVRHFRRNFGEVTGLYYIRYKRDENPKSVVFIGCVDTRYANGPWDRVPRRFGRLIIVQEIFNILLLPIYIEVFKSTVV